MIFGWEHLALRYSRPLVEEPTAGELMREPVPGLLLEADGGWILVDSGLNAPLVRDPAHYSRFWGNEHIDVELPGPPDTDPLEGAFELAGVDPRPTMWSRYASATSTTTMSEVCATSPAGFRSSFNGPSTTGPLQMP